MTTYRLFIAIDLPFAAKQDLLAVQDSLKSVQAVRWPRPEQIHLTLQFLGDTPSTKVETIVTALKETVSTYKAFKLVLTGLGAFPNLKRPRVVWVGLNNQITELSKLHQAVITATKKVGFKPEDRPYKPHLTIGRVQKWAKPKDYMALKKVLETNQVGEISTFKVNHIALIRSQLKPSGPIYTTLAEIQLKT